MRVWLALLVAVLSGPVNARGQAPDPATSSTRVQRVAGCYALATGHFAPEPHARIPAPTTLFQLDTAAGPRWAGSGSYRAHRLQPDTSAPAALRPVGALPRPALWRLHPDDSLSIVLWSTGFEAEMFYGHTTPRGLQGMIRYTSDARIVAPKTRTIRWDAYPSATATGTRVACPVAAR